ncbi:histidine phosphatase family protein [Alteribacillus sp. YIM 98480]|uniref:histidine phosphatase family protein n=1 Tax=Alteribacillus sp. YIM 98480 TaxID=2606599 RepID=UPI00131AB13E|nr:histidine phosphatase family protein [Alteribacillus sp. YIM 98480]
MTTICLVRHGETNWNRLGIMQGQKDISLNEKGIKQACLCGDFLKREHWDIIVSSPLKRAKKTAEIIGAYIGMDKVLEMDEFKERFYGEDVKAMKTSRKTALLGPDIKETESIQMLTDRSLLGLTILVNKNPGKKILVVSHGDVIRAILSAVSNREISYDKVKLENASLNLLYYNTNKWNIDGYNLISHLEKLEYY